MTNVAHFDWSDVTPAREVWYSLVTHPDEPIAFWYRYTLVSTGEIDEARVWAALSDAQRNEHTVVTQRYPLSAVGLSSNPFELTIGENTLTDSCAVGDIEGTSEEAPTDGRQTPRTSWSLSYTPDDLTFTPLESEEQMLAFSEQFGTGVHWSTNQSVSMSGTVTVGDHTVEFTDAPGHQGHTAGVNAPDDWTWLHCNDFEEGVSLELLSLDAVSAACLRLPDETYLINGDTEVFQAIEMPTNEPGDLRMTAETDEISVSATATVDDSHWQRVSYLTPDGSLRYNAHCSLTTVTLDVDGSTYESSGGRIEWVSADPPLPGSYPPFAP